MCWEAAGDLREAVSDDAFARGLTWDVRLAVALLEATSDPQIGGTFWHVYGRLLPQPHTIAVIIASRRVAARLCYIMLCYAAAAIVSTFGTPSPRGVLTDEKDGLDCCLFLGS